MARLDGINKICVVGSSCLDCHDLGRNDQRPEFSVITKTFPDGPGALMCQNSGQWSRIKMTHLRLMRRKNLLNIHKSW